LSYLDDVVIDEGFSEADFYALFKPGKYNAIILDLKLDSSYEGMNLLEYALNEDPEAPIIVLTGYASIETAIRSLKLGAKDYLEKEHFQDKPFLSLIERVIIEDKARKLAERIVANLDSENQIIGNDIKIKKLVKFADWLSSEREFPILIVGEVGTEKEEIAKYIYKKSGVRGKFIKKTIEINEEDIPNKLFGDDEGPGLIQQAQGGVLYLEEVFRLNSDVQQVLLDFINTGLLKRDRKKQEQKIKVQLILSTSQLSFQINGNKNPNSTFYYRVKTTELVIPPLRERGDDIILLSQYYLSQLKNKGKTTADTISRKVVEIFKDYVWQGNLMELKQTIESSALRAKIEESQEIKTQHLPLDLQKGFHNSFSTGPLILDKILAETTLQYMKIGLEKTGGTKLEAYRYLGYPDAKRGTMNSRFKRIFQTFPDLAGKFSEIYKLFMGN
jgi:DNA-binding NtrC family response regulator